MAVIVNKNRCNGCGACAGVCPVDAVEIKQGKAWISDKCMECGACIGECPTQALSMPRIKNVGIAVESGRNAPLDPGRGGGRGLMGGTRQGAGLGGKCICPKCGARIIHQRGVPCYSVNCTKCGTKMARE